MQTQIRQAQISGQREILLANRTYYVRTDGNDSNDGLANTAGGAFLTIQKAVDVAASLDTSIYDVTIQVGDGTYTGGVVAKLITGSGSVTIQGNSATPTNVVISRGSGETCFYSDVPSVYTIKDLRFTGSSSYGAIVATGNANVYFSGVNFFTGFTYHIESTFGSTVRANGNYTVQGGAAAHWTARGGGIVVQSKTVTITGTPAFTQWAECRYGGVMFANANTFSGSATGKRYNVDLNAVIQTAGGGATYLPGNVAGTTATGGQYA